MSVNPDIEESRIFLKLADEFVRMCELEDVTYGNQDHYTLMYIYAKAITSMTAAHAMKYFPCLCDAMTATENQFRRFDWPSLAIAVDQVRGKSALGLEFT